VSTAAAPQPAVTAGAQEEGSQPSLVLPLLQFPSVAVLFLWMIVPLGMTIYFSFIRKNLLNPELSGFAGLENYRFLWEDPAFIPAIINSIILIGAVLIAPFFVMPTVSALIWKNMMMHPVYGFLAVVFGSWGCRRSTGLAPTRSYRLSSLCPGSGCPLPF
jgi:sorbitol/mannitol transport system permease protein